MQDWETLLDDARRRAEPNLCKVGKLLASLPDGPYAALARALEDETIGIEGLASALARRVENAPGAETIRRHRRALCACGKGAK